MNILGLFGPGPNPSAVLIKDGQLVAFIEEERLNRIKTSPHSLPIEAARACLKIGGIGLEQVDSIAYAWDSPRYAAEGPAFFTANRKRFNDLSVYNSLQEDYLINIYHPDRIQHNLKLGLAASAKGQKLPPVYFYPHHLCHAASAFYCSGFSEANILTLDGSGEEVSTLLCHASLETGIRVIKKFELPDTIGGFYATFTEYLGFKAYQDEGKLMGLAAYGKYSKELQVKLDKVIPFDPITGNFSVDPTMRYIGPHTTGSRFTDKFVELFGPKRGGQSAMDAPYPDIAFAVQYRLEQIGIGLARQLHESTKSRNLCLAGGVAMNCKMNGKLASQDFVDQIFVQPAASDNGASLGAALLYANLKGEKAAFRLEHLYYGPEFSEQEIKKALDESKLEYRKSTNIAQEVAQYLYQDKIIGWFQGRMEVGARALGNRSILANPINRGMKQKLNLEVKHREDWRPFCPSMKEERYSKYIDSKVDSPFMIMAFPFHAEYEDMVPSCVHVDKTVRPQAVSKKHNFRFWSLIDEFEKLSGHGILINTSFNIQGEPIVCTPRDALRCFGGTGIDVLAMGDFIVTKSK